MEQRLGLLGVHYAGAAPDKASFTPASMMKQGKGSPSSTILRHTLTTIYMREPEHVEMFLHAHLRCGVVRPYITMIVEIIYECESSAWHRELSNGYSTLGDRLYASAVLCMHCCTCSKHAGPGLGFDVFFCFWCSAIPRGCDQNFFFCVARWRLTCARSSLGEKE